MRLVVVSDSHLSPVTPGAERNWEVALAHIERLRPDLVLHAGDICAEATDRPDDLAHAHRLLQRIPAPWRAVPGNHDLGNPDPDRELVDRWRCRYEAVFGRRFWQAELGGWSLVGLDSQALVAGHPDDDPAWQWTAEQLTGDRPIAVVQHRPLAPTSATEIDSPRRYQTEPGRSRMRELLAGSPVRLVISGHVHQWRDETIDGVRFLWAPSTWAKMMDERQPVIGTKVVGLLVVELDATAGRVIRAEVLSDGFEQLVLGETAPAAGV